MVEGSNERVSLLAVLPDPTDRDSLCGMIRHSNWTLDFANTYEDARAVLRGGAGRPIVTESCLPGGFGWRDLLQLTKAIQSEPPLIVTGKLADERLWAEVLNEGGYDVLTKPFEQEEVFRIVSYAWRSWKDRARHATERKPSTSAASMPFARSLEVGSGS
jgi:DNA-binding NtrC family response regulator